MMNASKNNPLDMLGRANVVSLVEARRILDQHLPPCPAETETLPLDETLDRICSENILSPENIPPYARSTMDGYAVRAAETFGASEKLPAYLEVSGDVAMGEYPEQGPAAGACFTIATGGIMPPGTDAVVMLEHTVKIDNRMIEVVQPAAPGLNVIAAGEDVAAKELLLPAGHRIRPQDVALLAGAGIKKISVFRRVRVGIISTGDEIVSHEEQPLPGKIRDTNSISLSALARSFGCIATFYGIASDEEESLYGLLRRAMDADDIVLLSGSSSVGTRDLGEKVISRMGLPGIILHGVSIKPGKPVIIARAGDTMIFGLPGHPVSAAVSFDLFVRPTISHLSGQMKSGLPVYRRVNAKLMRNISSASGRTDFIRVQLQTADDMEFEAHPVLGKSGALSTMVRAHGFIEISEEMQGIKAGEIVEVKLFD